MTDSATIIDGKFSFEGNIEELTVCRLDFDNSYVRIYIEPAKMKLIIDKDQPYAYKLTGTDVEKENMELREKILPYEKMFHDKLKFILESINRYNKPDDTSNKDSLANAINQSIAERYINSEKMDSIRLEFVSKHSNYNITPDLLLILADQEYINIDTIRSIYETMPEQLKESIMGQLANIQIERSERKKLADVGNMALDFTRESSSEQIIKLSELKNKNYILLDFWASWCGPCLKEMPKMKNLYNKYKDKDFTVIGVSLDEDKDSWLKAIEKHKLSLWPHILSKENNANDDSLDGDLSEVYNISNGIPFYILINKEGKIVARWEWLGEEQLAELDRIIKSE